jgi:thioredoxin-dependent peroxiredoxin
MDYKINVGDPVPPFIGLDAEGKSFSLGDLLGRSFVLYFYPKDDTPGCTKEACSFRDSIEQFDGLDAVVIGVSPDSASSHKKFMQKHHLNFTLLCDENKELCKKFDVLQEKQMYGKRYEGVERTTFVVDGKGIIRWIERHVSVADHTQRVIKALQDIASE